MLDCDICGEPVAMSPARYVAMVKAGERPRCRRNGCERLCGVQNGRTARSTEVLAVEEVGVLRVAWPAAKKGRRNGPLAKLRVTTDDAWRYESSPAEG